MLDRVRRALGIRAAESHRAELMFGYYFLCSLAMIVAETAGAALFLARCGDLEILNIKGVVLLPVIWVVSGIAVVPLATGMLEGIQRVLTARWGVRLDRMVLPSTAFVIAMLLGFRLAFASYEPGRQDWVLYTFPLFLICVEILYTFLTLNMEVSAGQLFNVREAKRVFGAIGSGPVLADIVGGLSVPLVVTLIGTENLLVCSMVVLLASAFLFAKLSKRYRGAFLAEEEEEDLDRAAAEFRPLRSGYVVLIAVFVLVSQLAYYLVDFQLMTVAEDVFAGRDESLASFFGLLFGSIGVAKLGLQLFVTGRTFARFGLFAGLAVLPMGLCLLGGLSLLHPFGLFSALILLKAWDDVFRYTFTSAGLPLLYQALPAQIAARAQNFVTGKVDPLSVGISGAVLLALVPAVIGLDNIVVLSAGVVGVALLWLLVIYGLRRRYATTLAKYLGADADGPGGLDLSATGVVQALHANLVGNDPRKAAYSLDLLSRGRDEDLLRRIPKKAFDPGHSVELCCAALAATASVPCRNEKTRSTLLERIEPLLKAESLTVQVLALEAYCALAEEDAISVATAALKHPSAQIRTAATLGLVAHCGIDGVLAADEALRTALASPDPYVRGAVARGIGANRLAMMRMPLRRLVEDGDVTVRREAIAAAGALNDPRLDNSIVAALGDYRTEHQAREAITKYTGERCVTLLSKRMTDEDERPRLRKAAARTLGELPSAGAGQALLDALALGHEDVRTSVHGALVEYQKRGAVLEDEPLQRQLEAELGSFFETVRCRLDLSATEWATTCVRALDARGQDVTARIWSLLALKYPGTTVPTARRQLSSGAAGVRASGLELLDATLRGPEKPRILAVFDELDDAEKLATGAAPHGLKKLDAEERLQWLLDEQRSGLPAWTIGCAIQAARRQGATRPDWAEKAAQRHAVELERFFEGTQMEQIIDRVVFLRGVPLFEGLRDDLLAGIAEKLEEKFVKAGVDVFEEGDPGDYMYIVKEGRVRVHSKGETFTEIDSGGFFGEMAILDAEPRSATVTAIEDTEFLRLSEEALVEAMDREVRIALGVIRTLSKRIKRKEGH